MMPGWGDGPGAEGRTNPLPLPAVGTVRLTGVAVPSPVRVVATWSRVATRGRPLGVNVKASTGVVSSSGRVEPVEGLSSELYRSL